MEGDSDIKAVLLREQSEISRMMSGKAVKREEDISNMLRHKLVKVIIGPRRAGKSFFSVQSVSGRRFAYINFDDEELLKVRNYEAYIKYLREIYGNFDVLLLDEIQNLNGWEIFVNRLQRNGYNMIVTGSNSKLLSTELATHLTGRHLQVPLLPFSFAEFLRALGHEVDSGRRLLEADEGSMLNMLGEYIERGGFPEVVVNNIDHKIYLKVLVDSIILKDVVKRHRIRFPSVISDLARYLTSTFSKEFSFNSTRNAVGINSTHTAKNYAGYLEEAFLFFYVERFSFRVKEQLKLPKKAYVIDTGIIDALGFATRNEYGRMMENAVATELLRRSELGTRFKFFYWKDMSGEVDFVIKEGLRIRQLIQVSYALRDRKTRRRELKALLGAARELRCRNLLVITWDEENRETHKNRRIIFTPLWKWLLERDW